MRHTMKHTRKILLSAVLLALVLSLVLTGCAGRRTLTAETFTAASEEAGYTVTDLSAQFDPAVISTALTVDGVEETTIGFFIFADESSAKSNYAQMLSGAKTGERGEKFVDSSEYNRFAYTSDTGTILLYRNGKTLCFISGTDIEKLTALIGALGI